MIDCDALVVWVEVHSVAAVSKFWAIKSASDFRSGTTVLLCLLVELAEQQINFAGGFHWHPVGCAADHVGGPCLFEIACLN